MKNTTPGAKKFAALIRRLPHSRGPGIPEDPAKDPIGTLVMSFLMWEATTEKAVSAYERIKSNIVDLNDLRVCMPEEVAGWIGVRYPNALDRCQRLRTCLRAVFAREHAMGLGSLSGSKREARKYLESLDAIVPYVAQRVLLLSYDTHLVPVDEQLRSRLVAIEVCEPGMDLNELSSWISHHVKAGHAVEVHQSLQKWAEKGAARAGKRSRPPVSRASAKVKA